jgi:hypothetical protein
VTIVYILFINTTTIVICVVLWGKIMTMPLCTFKAPSTLRLTKSTWRKRKSSQCSMAMHDEIHTDGSSIPELRTIWSFTLVWCYDCPAWVYFWISLFLMVLSVIFVCNQCNFKSIIRLQRRESWHLWNSYITSWMSVRCNGNI